MSSYSCPTFRLVFRDDRAPMTVEDPVVSIGRKKDSRVCLLDNGISRRHAQIVLRKTGWMLQDLGSANGTRVNGNVIKEHDLNDGDVIAFDRVTMRFEILEPPKEDQETVSRRVEDRVVYDHSDEHTSLKKKINLGRFTRGTVIRSPMAHRGADWAVNLFSRAARYLLSDQSLDDILERVMDLVFESVPAEQGLLCLYDEATGQRTTKVVRSGIGFEARDRGGISVSESIVRAALEERNAVLVTDTRDDDRFSAEESIVVSQTRTAMCAPLYHRGHAMGFIYVSSQNSRYPFDDQCLEVLTTLSVVSAVAVEQTQLKERVEREKVIRSRLERYSSPHIVQKIVDTSSVLEAEMIAESTVVSVLFADIGGFTTLSEKLSAAEVAHLLNEIFERFTDAVFSYDGTLDKFMGDGLMAIFGAPVAQEDHALRAVKAALTMQAQIGDLNAERPGGTPLSIRVGINSGPVIAGDIGSPTRKDYTVIGDTVNVASRLESSVARPGQVVIGPETYRLLEGELPCADLGPFSVKGREQQVNAWLVGQARG